MGATRNAKTGWTGPGALGFWESWLNNSHEEKCLVASGALFHNIHRVLGERRQNPSFLIIFYAPQRHLNTVSFLYPLPLYPVPERVFRLIFHRLITP